MQKEILIVEDNELNMKLMSDLMESLGHKVTKAADGECALNIIENNDFDLILLDIQLPKKSGYEVLKEMKKNIPTIVVSACCMDDEITKAKNKGCIDFVTKPIIIKDFVTKIQSYLKD